jgi:H+-transporting ATPase
MPDAVSAHSVNHLLYSRTLIDVFILRPLGVACKEGDSGWEFLGLLPMFVSPSSHHPVSVHSLIRRFDPPRLDTAQTIAEAGDLGVRVKMLTGDAVAIAKETCRQLCLGTNVYDSERLITGNTDMSGSNVCAPLHTLCSEVESL